MALIIAIILLLFSHPQALPGWIWSAQIPLPPAHAQVVGADAAHIRLAVNALAGPCGPSAREACALYVLAAAQEVIPGLSVEDVWGLVYQNELATVPHEDRRFAAQALARNFFDAQAGACRYRAAEGDNLCSEDWLIGWLSGMQGWVDRARMTGDGVEVNVERLLGITSYSDGYLAQRDWLVPLISAHLPLWRTGQGYGLPSTWGNTCIPVGENPQGLVFVDFIVGERETCNIHFLIVGPGNRHTPEY